MDASTTPFTVVPNDLIDRQRTGTRSSRWVVSDRSGNNNIQNNLSRLPSPDIEEVLHWSNQDAYNYEKYCQYEKWKDNIPSFWLAVEQLPGETDPKDRVPLYGRKPIWRRQIPVNATSPTYVTVWFIRLRNIATLRVRTNGFII